MRKIYIENLFPYRLLHALLITTAVFILSGCSDYEVAPSAGTINGKVFDIYGFPNIQSEISIGQYPVTVPDAFGNFSLDTKSIPYDLEIFDYVPHTYEAILFKSLISTCPSIVIPFEILRETGNFCVVWVKCPATQEHGVFLNFVSKEDCLQHMLTVYHSDSIYGIQVQIPVSKTSIEGKVLFLQYSGYNNTCTYDKYGEKSVTLHSGNNDTLVFSPSDILLDPPESIVTFNIILPDSLPYADITTRGYIHFPGYSSGSDILIYDGSDLTDDYITVPESLLTNFNIKINSVIHYYEGQMYYNDQEKWVYTQPGTSITVDNSEKVSLLSPQYAQTGIDENTVFRFSGDGLHKGVYIIYIFGYGNLVTDSTNFRITDLDSRSFNFRHNYTMGWRVVKLSEFRSLDDFVSKPYIDNENFNTISLSPFWYFRTAP